MKGVVEEGGAAGVAVMSVDMLTSEYIRESVLKNMKLIPLPQ